MRTRMLYCSKCSLVTRHTVVNQNGIEAILCKNCILRWANQVEIKEKHLEKASVNVKK